MTPYYADESVTLYHGDSLAVLQALPAATADALITDPPYSSGGMVRSDRTATTGAKYTRGEQPAEDFTGDNRDQRAYAYWCALWLGQALRVVKPGGVALLFTDWRQLPSTTDALQAGGWVWRGIVPWAKINARPMAGRFTAECEYVAWGSNGPMAVDFTPGAGLTLPGFYRVAAPREREHQSQKPLEVMRDLVKIVPRNGAVLDPFMGSGTTGAAALVEGRRFIGCEMVEHFVQVAERRIRIAAGQAVTAGQEQLLDFADVS